MHCRNKADLTCIAGHKDAGGGGGSVRSPLDAISDSSGCEFVHGSAVSQHLVPALLPHVHLHQQRRQPHHLQRHVAEVLRCF